MKSSVKSRAVKKVCRIVIENGSIKTIGREIKKNSDHGQVIVLTNNIVKRIWIDKVAKALDRSKIQYKIISIPDGEKYKNLNTYEKVTAKMTAHNIDRYATLLSVGGGVIGDLGGFIASTYKRGIRHVHIPTTLIAQIDSSIGGKTAIDTPSGKNLIGAFYNPELILTDPIVLKTLDQKELINGLFEAIKIGLVSSPAIFKFIELNISKILEMQKSVLAKLVTDCAKEKIKIIEKDPFDKNLRMILNFGHTFGHALELQGDYKTIPHGRAVGLGMLIAFNLSVQYGYSNHIHFQAANNLIRDLLGKFDIGNINPNQLWKTMLNDKKAKDSSVRFILLKRLGKPILREVSYDQFKKGLIL